VGQNPSALLGQNSIAEPDKPEIPVEGVTTSLNQAIPRRGKSKIKPCPDSCSCYPKSEQVARIAGIRIVGSGQCSGHYGDAHAGVPPRPRTPIMMAPCRAARGCRSALFTAAFFPKSGQNLGGPRSAVLGA
jgi:hypothetical protein